jgi:hypothetical protein
MEQEHPLVTLFNTFSDLDNPPRITLLDINRKPVGSIDFSQFKYKNLIVTETNNSEKYYLWADGLGIYFSFYQKIGS